MKKTGSTRWTNLSRGISILLALMLAIQLLPPTARAEEENILTNPSFANNSADGWQNFGNWTYSDGTASLEIKSSVPSSADDWTQSLIQRNVTLEEPYSYTVSATITTTVARSVVIGFEEFDNRAHTFSLEAYEEKKISFTTDKFGTGSFGIYFGLTENEFNEVGEHTVTVKDISIVKGDRIKAPGEDTADGPEVAEVEGNLLKNGNFANKQENWEAPDTNADVYFNQYRTVFYLKDSAVDWQQGLKQTLKLEDGTKYTVSFTVETSVARTVTVNLKEAGKEGAYTSSVIPENQATKVTFETDGFARDDNSFYLYLGGVDVDYPHSVVITDVSVVAAPITFEKDTPNDTPPKAVESIKEIPADEGVILKDGNFTQGLEHWETWVESWISTYDSVHFVPAEGGGMIVQINADVEDNKPWSIQLNQKISLKANREYTISFDVTSDKPRAFNVVIDQLYGDGKSFSKMIGLQANKERHVVLNVGELQADAPDKTFSFQLGWVSEQEKPNTNITFKNIKIEINGYSDKAVLIPDGDFADGLGEFTASTSGSSGSEITVDNGNVLANIQSGTAGIAAISTVAQGDTLSRTVDGMENGANYTLSFVAGAVSGKRDITVTLPNGENKIYNLTDEAVEYTADFTANKDSGELKFDFSGEDDIICLDTVRLDIKGYAEAAGIDAADHDITRLTKNTPPLLSEMAGAVSGQDVTLTYEANADFKDKITGVKVDGVPVNDYTATENGKITIPGSHFTVDGGKERQTFNITVSANWYYDAKAIQIVYASNMWRETWSDEFTGSELNTNNWGYQDGTGAEYGLDGWGNNEQQYYTRNNLTVDGGLLTITATSGQNGKKYDSARIWTMNDDQTTPKFAQTYGRFEAKMKLPAGSNLEGLWPAFWLLPVDSVYGGWPLSGEIDIMEARGREGNKADGTIHFGRPWPNDGSAGDTKVWEDPLAITEYHIYSVDWTPEYMSFQVDGEEYYRVNNWYSEDPAQPTKNAFGAPFDQPFYIVLNMAVGGTYDGNREPASGSLPATMCVDYVRVYQMTDTTKTADGYMPAEPEVEATPIPDGAKDTIIDPEFTNVKKVVHDNDSRNTDGWNLLTLEAYGGAADFSKVTAEDGAVFGKVNITAAGNQNYAVQLTQKLALYTGNWYTLSFDAYADSNHTIIAKIGGDGTNSWSAYNSVEVPLTQSVRHYEYIFQMLNTSDPSSRLELNMNYATGGVYFANVKLEHADGLTINHDVPKAPLDDGNGIYNGSFELGTVDRLAYWHADGGQVVRQKETDGTYNHVFKASGDNATVYQLGVELLQSDHYVLSAKSTGTVYVTVTSADGSVTYLDRHLLTATASNAFTMPVGVTDKNAKITFTLASGATLDNVFLERTTFNNVDYSGLDCYPLVNGDFEHQELGWGTYNTDLTVQSTTEEGHGSWVGAVVGKKTDHTYDALLSYDTLHLLGGYSYVISFDIKASSKAVIDVALEDASYNRAFQHDGIEIGTEWQHHEHQFKLSSDATLSLKFLVGGADENYTLYLDNVVLKLAGAPAQPGAFLPKDYNRLTDDITIPFIGTTEWTNAAKLYLDGKLLNARSYKFEGENLVLNADLFDDDGVYSLSAKAEGYADTPAVELWIYPANGERLINGGFSDGSEGWETYTQNNCATLDFDSSFLSARYLHAEGDEWGNPAVPWAIQLNQYFPADPGTYTLHFYAESEVERYIMVTVKNVSANSDVIVQKVMMDTTWSEHSFDVQIQSSGTYQLQFFLSAVNPNTDNGYFESGTYYIDYQPHNFYLNGVSFLPKNAEYIPSTVKPVLTLDVPATATFGSTVTVTAVLDKEPMLESEEEPDGTLTFYVDGSEIESDGPIATLTGLALGEHTVKVVFTPDESETLYEAAEAEAVVTVTNVSGSSGGSGGIGSPAQSGPAVSPDGVKGETHRTGGTVTSAEIVISEAAAQTGKVLTAPVEIPGSSSSDKAPEIAVKVEGERSARLEIPVKGVTPGTVAVVVNPDGTETVVRDSVVTETGVVLNVSGEMTVKLVDMASNFNDTASVPWALDAIAFASARELINGTAPGTFSPGAKTDRATVVTVLYRLAYEPDADTSGFGDVEEGKWYSDAIDWARANGVVNGYGDGTFGPSDSVTREQFAVILFNYAKKLGYDVQKRAGLTVYNDVNAVSPWARDAMEWAAAAGLIQGKGNATLDPSGTATRAEMVTLVMRFSELSLDK